jgi:NAD-dependent SIR2 family protein deacetylase
MGAAFSQSIAEIRPDTTLPSRGSASCNDHLWRQAAICGWSELATKDLARPVGCNKSAIRPVAIRTREGYFSSMTAPCSIQDFVDRHRRLFVLTGAGCSTNSGIPDYRDAEGNWKRQQPVTYQAFMADEATRRRYWARSLVGWRRFGRALPNDAHRALARLEAIGRSEVVLTQNVDRLHQAAGNDRVIDLHGRLDLVRCMGCGRKMMREELQQDLGRLNADWGGLDAADAPDGDADLVARDFSLFSVPACPDCDGLLKPDVVFFGETVSREVVRTAAEHLQRADAMLIVGSSLMVYSGFRFVQMAARAGIPIAAVNLGRTRADELLALKVQQPCEAALAFLL